MEIILKENVIGLGFKDDIVNVKNGYGRNYLIPTGKAVIASESAKNLLVALYFHEQSGTGHIASANKHTVWRQLLKDMRLTSSFWTQFHEIEVVLNMREQTSQRDELLTSVHWLWIQTHCMHQKVYPFISCEILSLVDIVLQVDV